MNAGRDLDRLLGDPIDEREFDALLERMIEPRLRAAARREPARVVVVFVPRPRRAPGRLGR
jgi:hypothetical protein